MSTSLDVVPEENERRAAFILHQVQHELGATVFFEKPLTASDTSGSGRVVIPKAIAEQYFPRLEQPSGLPVRAVDTRGHEYTFKFRFWINNQSRMYLLEGAGELHRQFTMVVGDVMVFAQKQDRTLVVAGRPATKNDVIRKAPVKRPAGDTKEKSKGGREHRVKQSKVSSGTVPTPHRKRAKTGEQFLAPSLELEPAVDGIFRAVPDASASTEPSGVAPGPRGRWVVTLNLAGELYQALFDSQEDAEEALNAAGGADSNKGTGMNMGLDTGAVQGFNMLPGQPHEHLSMAQGLGLHTDGGVQMGPGTQMGPGGHMGVGVLGQAGPGMQMGQTGGQLGGGGLGDQQALPGVGVQGLGQSVGAPPHILAPSVDSLMPPTAGIPSAHGVPHAGGGSTLEQGAGTSAPLGAGAAAAQGSENVGAQAEETKFTPAPGSAPVPDGLEGMLQSGRVQASGMGSAPGGNVGGLQGLEVAIKEEGDVLINV